MKTVYILQSVRYPDRHYTGITDDLSQRIAEHNGGKSPHTAKHRPWGLKVVIDFAGLMLLSVI